MHLRLFSVGLFRSIVDSCIRRVLREPAKVVLFAAMLAFGIAPVPAQSGSSIPSPVISIVALDAHLAPGGTLPVFTWRTDGRLLDFGAFLTRYESSPVDVYFGIIVPGGRIFSWSPGTNNVPNLQEGFVPAAQRTTATEMSSGALLGGSPQHSFSANHPLGLYSVFFFLVPAGADPRDLRQWYGATMSPLVITN